MLIAAEELQNIGLVLRRVRAGDRLRFSARTGDAFEFSVGVEGSQVVMRDPRGNELCRASTFIEVWSLRPTRGQRRRRVVATPPA